MKTLLTLDGGALVLTEQGGQFTLSFNEKASIGGGAAAGVVSVQGTGSVILSGAQAAKLLETVINSHLPVAIAPAVEAGEALVNAAIAGA